MNFKWTLVSVYRTLIIFIILYLFIRKYFLNNFIQQCKIKCLFIAANIYIYCFGIDQIVDHWWFDIYSEKSRFQYKYSWGGRALHATCTLITDCQDPPPQGKGHAVPPYRSLPLARKLLKNGWPPFAVFYSLYICTRSLFLALALFTDRAWMTSSHTNVYISHIVLFY